MHQRLSLHQVCMIGESNATFLDVCRKTGLARAVVASGKLAGGGLEEVRGWTETGKPAIESVNHVLCPDLSRAGEEATEGLMQAVAAARALQAHSVYMLTGGRRALDWEGAADRFVTLVAPCREAARDGGVELLVENASPLYADLHIAHSLDDTIALAERAGIGVCVELFFCWADAGIGEKLRRAAPLVGLVQVSDYVLGDRALPARAVPGDGAIPLERILGEVLAAGYSGAFDIELVGPRIAAEGARAAAARAAERVSEMLVRLGA